MVVSDALNISCLLLLFTDGKGNWVSDGCTNKSRYLNTIVCECNHLSVFGVLVVSTCAAHVHGKKDRKQFTCVVSAKYYLHSYLLASNYRS